jgi:hypothetical protein
VDDDVVAFGAAELCIDSWRAVVVDGSLTEAGPDETVATDIDAESVVGSIAQLAWLTIRTTAAQGQTCRRLELDRGDVHEVRLPPGPWPSTRWGSNPHIVGSILVPIRPPRLTSPPRP